MGTVRLLGVALVALVVGLAVGYFIPGPVAAKPTLSLSASSVLKGASFTVKLSGFPANVEIYGWVVNENPPRTFEVGVTDAQGQLEVSGYAPGTPGKWLLCASDKDYQYWATAVLTVT
jgi:hypothetical protein